MGAAILRVAKRRESGGAGVTGLRGQPRKRRTKEELAKLDDRIVAVLEVDHPQSVRHVFYRMTDPTGPVSVPKTEAGYNTIVRRCTALRRSGRVPYGWITDTTRQGYHVRTFGSGADLIAQFAGLYRVDAWRDAKEHVEVWCESRSIAGVIQGECDRLGVSMYPTGGFSSLTLTYQAAEGIRRDAAGRPVRIVYVGDWDPAGVLIDEDVIGKLRGHLPDLQIDEVRIAITAEQAAVLPSKPRKSGDRRRLDIRWTVEAEAMPAAELRELLRSTVESFMPAGALKAATVAERSEREGLTLLAKVVQGEGGPLAVIKAAGWEVK